MAGFDDDFLDNVVNTAVLPSKDISLDDDDFLTTPLKVDSDSGITFTNEMKAKVLDAWNNGVSDLKTLIQSAFGAGYDGRSKQGMEVKKFLAEQNLKARPAHVQISKTGLIKLTEANKELIANSAKTTKPLEITKLVFNNPMLTALSAEFRVVKEYYDSLDPKLRGGEDESLDDYRPPKTEQQSISRINRYVFEAIDVNKISPRQREGAQRLIKFMHTHRYLFEMNNLPLNSERELFESSFVRFVFDKPDLTEEEIDLYLNQCSDIVSYQRMQKELVDLTSAAKTTMESEQKVPMALVEAIGKLRGNMDDNFKRQKTTLNDLNGKRANRLDKLGSNADNMLKLVEAFRNEENRLRVVKLMEMRSEQVAKEADRLESLDDLRFQLWGARKGEVS